MRLRKISTVVEPLPVLEGAGVLVRRTIAGPYLRYLDPFLLLDHFESKDRREYEAGFPMHPHRGIETVTYVISGEVQHQDTLGNKGSIGAGDVQWMTSGRGIMHEEMPQVRPEGICGFQLWVNLPAAQKMTKPNYQDLHSDQIPAVFTSEGAMVKVLAGRFGDVQGAVKGIGVDPYYMDILVPPKSRFVHSLPAGHNVFAYVFEGKGCFDESVIPARRLIVFADGDTISVQTGEEHVRLLLVSGQPLHEPVARYGPFVMNTREEIEQALEDLRRGTFVRYP